MELLIRNGYVVDPLNKVDCEKMDIAVKDGKIVERVSSSAEIIDASNMLIMPGGVDIHSHIAGSKVNAARMLRPEDHYKDLEKKGEITRSGVGHSVPSTFTTGYRYARMGYTTVVEPATPPLKARHTHEELNDTPIIDKACFILLGNNWHVMEYLAEGDFERCSAYVAWMLRATKGYAIKIVNPGGIEAWHWGRNVSDFDEEVPHFNITPREIVKGLCKVNRTLGLPHTIHVHPNNIGKPGNYATTIKTMDSVKGIAMDGEAAIHIAHCQFTSFKGEDWSTLRSGAEEVAKYVNKNRHATLDLGQVIFTATTTMTADGPFEYILHQLQGRKWYNADVEAETGAGIVPVVYKRRNYVNATQWAIGLELALLVKDPWRVFLTTDHPNGGPFTAYPRVISWLMSRKAREKTMEKLNRRAVSRASLPSIGREYTFYEIAIVTRAGTAKALGLKNKGHLGFGADADIAIYDVNPKEVDPSTDYRSVRRAMRIASYTIKEGEIVSKDGEIKKSSDGRTFWVDVETEEDLLIELSKSFQEYYTIQMGSYSIDEGYLVRSSPIKICGG
ncbi:MAG: formylmethanofuran dehydrogenase subunit A [Thermoproteota archaeon]